MMGRNIRFKGVLWDIIPKLSFLPLLIWSTGHTVVKLPCSFVCKHSGAVIKSDIIVRSLNGKECNYVISKFDVFICLGSSIYETYIDNVIHR